MSVKKGSILSTMLVLTVNGHDGQFDKGGNPYILHPLRIMHRLRTEDEFLQCIALGHDLVEDCGGEQWGEHRNCDELLARGLAAGFCTFPMERSMWSVLPGGLPYVSVDTSATAEKLVA